jgi:type III pantothenate kinase
MKTPAPEFLLIDCGNTRLKWATARMRGPIRVCGEIATGKASATWIASLGRKYPRHQLVLASVVPKTVPAFHRNFSKRIETVTGKSSHLGLSFNYPKPDELGADRLAAAVGAHELGRFPGIIVACGTATAFTVLDAKGRLCGGAIAPGLQTQLTALIGVTAQLPDTILKPPRSPLAKSTQEAIRVGVLLNFQGGAKEIILQLSKALPDGKKPRVILTGGTAPHLAANLDLPFELRPLLVFEGLRIIGARALSKTL